MYRTLYCLQTRHDWKLVVLAALVCLIASAVTVVIVNRASSHDGSVRLRWTLTAGVAGGFGIWATHFIAMLAFNPGVPFAFDLKLTVLSLLAAMAVTAGGIEVALSRDSRLAPTLGGAVMGWAFVPCTSWACRL